MQHDAACEATSKDGGASNCSVSRCRPSGSLLMPPRPPQPRGHRPASPLRADAQQGSERDLFRIDDTTCTHERPAGAAACSHPQACLLLSSCTAQLREVTQRHCSQERDCHIIRTGTTSVRCEAPRSVWTTRPGCVSAGRAASKAASGRPTAFAAVTWRPDRLHELAVLCRPVRVHPRQDHALARLAWEAAGGAQSALLRVTRDTKRW